VILSLDANIFKEILPFIVQIKGRGFDSILAAVAMKASSFLITNDKKQYMRLKSSTIGFDMKLLADMSVNEAMLMGET